MIALTFLFGLLFTTQVMSSHTPSFDVSIFARQATGSLPSATGPCVSPCEALSTNSDTCTNGDDTFDCVCSPDYGQSFVQCAQCVVNEAGSTSTLGQTAENDLQDYSDICSQNGHPFNPPLTLQGSGPTGNSANGITGTKSGSGSTIGVKAGNGAAKLSLTGTVAMLGLFAIGFIAASSV
ncbi:hypothetical protein M422DRAFT_56980 [Sphaerobolus stellatus SS14]|uniref:Extracellular membrane protein CFEM domain-containing protein n=1 Tax=Sphaerobolus stellatus (strain SS14) TaxID=990650 RepID=A0A0C9UD57_SPHS4|nr:hypothetical protein M422DRAFT_56980 [Sphaerobolus stellatus SS14]